MKICSHQIYSVPNSDNIATAENTCPIDSLNDTEKEVLLSLAREAGVVKNDEDNPLDQTWKAILPPKYRGRVDWVVRARVAVQFIVLVALGYRSREAMRMLNVERYGYIAGVANISQSFRRMSEAAVTSQLTAIKGPVLDAVIDAAIDGDTMRAFDREGRVTRESHKANTRAAEIVLKAADPRFREDRGHNAAASSGGITYVIGEVKVAVPVALPSNMDERCANQIKQESVPCAQYQVNTDFSTSY